MTAKVKTTLPRKPDLSKKSGKKGKGGAASGPVTKIDTPSAAIDYTCAVDELLQLYTRIDKAAVLLPTVSFAPLGTFFWNFAKFYVALIGDMLLILPINIVVFIRNLFPGRWSYKCFSWRYLKAAGCWLWSGEFWVPSIHVRPFTIGLLHWHFRSRLSELRRRILLETNFSEDRAKAALVKIDRALDVWQQRTTVRSILFTWVLPLVGPLTALWNWLFPSDFLILPSWTRLAVFFSVSYALGILATAFLAKRGLMLGGADRAAYYPGFLPGEGVYGQEKEILRPLGLAVSEFPLDAAIFVGSLVLVPFSMSAHLEMLRALQPNTEFASTFWSSLPGIISSNIFQLIIMGLALLRRRRLGRA